MRCQHGCDTDWTERQKRPETAPEVQVWLDVPGDLDDFIYCGEEPRRSEK